MKKKNNSPCPKCGKNNRQNCGYGVWVSTSDGRDFDCTADDVDCLCDDCPHVFCDECKKNIGIDQAPEYSNEMLCNANAKLILDVAGYWQELSNNPSATWCQTDCCHVEFDELEYLARKIKRLSKEGGRKG